MEPMVLSREIKLKDVEVLYLTRDGIYGEFICYILFMDLKRPSKLSDWPYIGIDSEEEFEPRANFIKAYALSHKPLEKELVVDIAEQICAGFLQHKPNCAYNVSFDRCCRHS